MSRKRAINSVYLTNVKKCLSSIFCSRLIWHLKKMTSDIDLYRGIHCFTVESMYRCRSQSWTWSWQQVLSCRNIVNKWNMAFIHLLVLGFLYKMLSRRMYTYIREKHGTETLRLCRGFERLNCRLEKTKLDLRYLLTCKRRGLIPNFAKPKVSINGGDRLSKKIATMILKTELKNKHKIKDDLKKKIEEICRQIREKRCLYCRGSWTSCGRGTTSSTF